MSKWIMAASKWGSSDEPITLSHTGRQCGIAESALDAVAKDWRRQKPMPLPRLKPKLKTLDARRIAYRSAHRLRGDRATWADLVRLERIDETWGGGQKSGGLSPGHRMVSHAQNVDRIQNQMEVASWQA